jgi:hypothetical protein
MINIFYLPLVTTKEEINMANNFYAIGNYVQYNGMYKNYRGLIGEVTFLENDRLKLLFNDGKILEAYKNEISEKVIDDTLNQNQEFGFNEQTNTHTKGTIKKKTKIDYAEYMNHRTMAQIDYILLNKPME